MINKPIVFADQHHLSLFNSLKILFEDRLGGKLYRPIGKDWLNNGYWRMAEIYNNHPETIEQYLGIRPDFIPKDGSMPLNRVLKIEDDVYYIWDPEYLYYHNAITLEKFMEMPIDIVIASIPDHIESFKRLCDAHPNHPKLIYQVGNAWTIEQGAASNIMASAVINNIPPEINFISYHQEFDLKIFQPSFNNNSKNIYSFINCLNTAGHYAEDWALFQRLETQMPDWNFKSFGGSCRDGAANGAIALADKMREAKFIWHTKRYGDGYGHILHNAAAVARPVIIKMADYQGKLGERLLIDGETCIAIDNLTSEEIKSKIEHYSEPELYSKMCQNVYNNFKKVVDFDKEFEEIKVFLDKLQ